MRMGSGSGDGTRLGVFKTLGSAEEEESLVVGLQVGEEERSCMGVEGKRPDSYRGDERGEVEATST